MNTIKRQEGADPGGTAGGQAAARDAAGTARERQEAVAELARRFGAAAIYAFGSRSRQVLAWVQGQGEAMPDLPDVDVGVRPVPGHSWGVEEKVRMSIALEDLLGCSRVDLVVLPEADPFVAAQIIRGERLHARDGNEADEYDLYILRRAGDLAPLERERIMLIMGARA